MNVRILFILFIIYSVIGWLLEVINCLIYHKKLVNRGFLIGPYCPIYGIGAILMTLFVAKTNDLSATFLKCMAICSILEYITSYIMEKLFKTRWWDYSNYKFNLNGRICLRTMIEFGIGGLIIVEITSPFLLDYLNSVPNYILTIISIITFIVFFTDIIVSYNVISSFKKLPILSKKDSTEEITKMVRETLNDRNYLYSRLVKSFPNFQSTFEKYDKKIVKQLRKLEKDKEKLRNLRKNRK